MTERDNSSTLEQVYNLCEQLDEKIEQSPCSRRQAVLGALTLCAGGTVVAPIPWRVDERLSRAEAILHRLASEVTDASLGDPRNLGELTQSIREGVETVDTLVTHEAVNDGEAVDATTNDLAKAFPLTDPEDYSRTEYRIATIEGAKQYYRQAANALSATETRRVELRRDESKTLYHDFDLNVSNIGVSNRPIDNMLKEMPRIREIKGRPETSEDVGMFLPSEPYIRNGLETHKRIYRTFGNLLKNYYRSSLSLQRGADAHERSDLATARNEFQAARKRTSVEIHSRLSGKRLADRGLSTLHYRQIFDQRHSASKRFLKACNESMERKERFQAFDEGLDKLFQAIQVVQENSSRRFG